MSNVTFDFSGKAAFITGGASGIGLAVAERFAASGAALAIGDLNREAGEALVARLVDRGVRAIFVSLDVTDPASVQAAVERADTWGGIDFAVNCAGVLSTNTALQNVSLDEWRRIMSVNVDGVFFSMQAELRVMLRQGAGCIVNISSEAGLRSAPLLAPYSASKHAVLGLTRSAALEMVDKGIRVNAVCPAAVDTPMLSVFGDTLEQRQAVAQRHPMSRLAKPEEVATMVAFACCDGAAYSTGVVFRVNGGVGI